MVIRPMDTYTQIRYSEMEYIFSIDKMKEGIVWLRYNMLRKFIN